MSAELQAFSDFIRVFGFPIFVVLLFGYLILVPRRDKVAQRDLSPRLVPGTAYDDLIDELAAVRSEALLRTAKAREECEVQVTYFRDLYHVEHERFVEVNANAIAQTKLMEQMAIEMRESRKRASK